MPTQQKTKCPHCQIILVATEERVGKRVRCRSCRKEFVLAFDGAVVAKPTPAPDSHPGLAETLDVMHDSSQLEPRGTEKEQPAKRAEKVTAKLGRFEIKAVLGQGAFGRVFKAHDPLLDRFVALKVPIFQASDTELIQRFLTEARAAARLHHPNIVPTFESGQADGRYFIASQFVAGQPLSKRLKETRPDFRQAAEWVRQLAGALAYAHGQGIVHRDIKPDNIMLNEEGIPQLMDFGLAKCVNDDAGMTTDGSIMGTPVYMPPEQARGDVRRIGPHSDQYSLGAVLYEMLTGNRPFDGSIHSVLNQVLSEEPPAPRSLRAEIPKDLEAICQKAMSKETGQRYETTAAFAGDLERWLRGEATYARPISALERFQRWRKREPMVAGLIVAVALVTLVGFGGISLALWRANTNAALAESRRIDAENSLREADEQRQLAQDNLKEADRQGQAAKNNLKLAESSAAEAKAARDEAVAKSRALEETIGKLQTAEGAKLTLETAKATLERDAVASARERDEALKKSPEIFYRDRVTKADAAIKAAKLDLARSLLEECPHELRHWEWWYLMALARESKDVVRTVTAPSQPLELSFSRAGKYVLCRNDNLALRQRRVGGATRQILTAAYEDAASALWTSILAFQSGQIAHLLPNEYGSAEGGMICAFGKNEEELLTLTNSLNGKKTHARLFQRQANGSWESKQSVGFLEGFAVACVQDKNDEWLVLTTGADKSQSKNAIENSSYEVKRPLTLHFSFRLRRVIEMESPAQDDASPLQGVCFDDEARALQLMIGNEWREFDLATAKRLMMQSSAASVRLPVTKKFELTGKPNPRFQADSGLGILPLVHGSAFIKSHVSPANAGAIVVDNIVRDDMALLLDQGAGTFTHDGNRLLLYSRENGLMVYDPRAPDPTHPLLQIETQHAEKAEGVTITISANGSHVITGDREILTLIDVSSGQTKNAAPGMASDT